MQARKRTSALVLTVLLAVFFALPAIEAEGQVAAGTRMLKLRSSTSHGLTRLIFDADGDKPSQVGPASEDGVSVFFPQITAKIPDKVISDKSSPVKEVKFRRGSGFLEVLFKVKSPSFNYKIQDGKKGRYTLILEIGPPATKTTAVTPQETPSKEKAAPAPESKRIDTSELFASKLPANIKNAIAGLKTPVSKADAEKNASPKPQFAELDEKTAGLFAAAGEKFDSCSRNLVECGPEVIELYAGALRTGAKTSEAPQAMYRSGLVLLSMGNYSKAEKLFRQVVSEWPEHPAASRCWIGIGNIYNKKHSYIEALEAFRSALRIASEKEDRAAANFELGRELQILGVSKEAAEFINLGLAEYPELYLKHPEVFRLLGEAEFSLGIYDKARDHLLRYVNYQESAPDQDMALAKLAETFLNLGDAALAGKIYAFLQKYYTDSEGDLISRVRQAEFLERSDHAAAFKVYSDLCSKDLSPSLRKIVYYKLASLSWKRGDLERSMELMDEVFQGKNDIPSGNEMAALRERVLGDLIRKNYIEKNFIAVLQMHDKYRRILDGIQSVEVHEDIAESYGALQFYSVALEIYDRLIAKGLKKGEDVMLRCALYSVRADDRNRALQYCRLVQSDSMDPKKSEILGHIFSRDQKYAEAQKLFGKVVQKGKELELTDPDSLLIYGSVLHELKKFDEAVPVLQKGLERANSSEGFNRRSLLMTLGKCFRELKQYPNALEMLEFALKLSKDEEANEVLYELADVHFAAGQADKAVQILNQIVGTNNPFWVAVAQQQLNSIEMSQKPGR
ncbi:MAG: tetratricopeptide repeat protein [Desulfobacteraceae bacterium]|nr:tetratricopeptide repeat protein [Desulfobacteraceae bacterium]